MPVYEYFCESCEHQFELLLSANEMDKPLKESCPDCNKKKVKRSVSRVITGADATLTLDKQCPGFTKRMEEISKAPVINRSAKRNILAAADMKPSGHLRPN